MVANECGQCLSRFRCMKFFEIGTPQSRVGGPTPQKRRFPHRPSQLDGVKHNRGPDSGHVSERLCFESRGLRSGEKDRDRLFSCSTPSKRRVGVPEVRGESGWSVFGVLVLPSSPRRRELTLWSLSCRLVLQFPDPFAVWTGQGEIVQVRPTNPSVTLGQGNFCPLG